MSQDKEKLIEVVKQAVRSACYSDEWGDMGYAHDSFMRSEPVDGSVNWLEFLLETFGLSMDDFEFDEYGYFKD